MNLSVEQLEDFLPIVCTGFGACESAMRHLLHCLRNNLIPDYEATPDLQKFRKFCGDLNWHETLIIQQTYQTFNTSMIVNSIISLIEEQNYLGIGISLNEYDGHCVTLVKLNDEKIYLVHAYANKFGTRMDQIDLMQWSKLLENFINEPHNVNWDRLFKVKSNLLETKLVSITLYS